MSVLELLQRASQATGSAMARSVSSRAWAWRRADLEPLERTIFRVAPFGTDAEIARAVSTIRANGLSLDTVEQEDFRIPSFARDVAALQRALDDGPGIVVLRGLELDSYDDGETGIIAWGLGNYLGRPMRQGLIRDRRLFTVTDRGAANRDPTRLGASNKLSRMHTDNGCLEPRPPCYVGLLCVRAAQAGGASRVAAAATLHEQMLAECPDLLAELYRPFHFLPPQLHTWPAGPQTIVKPIFEHVDGAVRIHYARVMIEPGMELAGTPLTARQRAALDALDAVMERPELFVEFGLERGDFMITNNLQTIHGRAAYSDGDDDATRRMLKRVWMWRRHVGPGVDPVALDHAELHNYRN
jgi:alpha-ketoglutarate-dependent taurine dioxygenase